jgi:hypothetical protein
MAKIGWERDIRNKLGSAFNFKEFADIIVPITFGGHWVILACNFEKRCVTILYFKESTGKKQLGLLIAMGSILWETGCKMGLKCIGENYTIETTAMNQW